MAEKDTSNKERPLAGVVLCFTSILPEQRSELAIVASQMGATHKFDLTSDVTHLLIGEVNTPKYKFVARERADVTVLKPEWVEAVRQSWMQGGDTDIRALEDQYKFPTFAGLSICITGFEDMFLRNHIQDTVTAHGAEFRKDLTKTITHLIARNTEGEKYKFATQWGIKIVTLKWYSDSLERGMVLEETLYHPLLPEEQQGAGAWNRLLPTPKPKVPENENPSNPRPRKLRRIASAKLGDQNEGIWGDIVGTGFDSSEPKRPRESQQRSQSLIKSAFILQESRSFASETTFAEVQERPQPSEAAVERRDGFLDGCYFFIHGFSTKQTNVLRDHLAFNGAQLVGSMSEFSRPDIPKRGHGLYTIVPYKMPRAQVPSTDDLAFECEMVTDMWLERCLDAKTLVPPESHVANTPVPSFPIKGFAGMKVCSTGFSRIDLLHLSKLVNLIGATYHEYLTPNASILICNGTGSVNPDKLRHTQEWGVPTVSADWLWASIRGAQKQPVDPYLIQKPPTQSSKSLEPRAGSRSEQQKPPPNSNEHPTHSRPRHEPEQPKPSITHHTHNTSSTSSKPPPKPSPIKAPNANTNPSPTISTSPPLKRKPSDQPSTTTTTTTSTAQSALNQAVNGLLKHAPSTTSAPDRPRGRRPLLGRAPSSFSLDHHPKHFSFSRASSIDTLNEDGCGSALDSFPNSNTTTDRNPYTSRYEYHYPEQHGIQDEDEENDAPVMTQLDYEDPDAVAMREKFLHQAGKIVEKKKSSDGVAEGRLVPGLENAVWSTGRRTRANRVLNDF
ncbi:subunit of DNA polymerase II [Aspergillus sclerotioniger CBS 115572]|uniref:Subunit of DNA polymerase II n=1 Tax=Aspergillus sclerotioniger CBS 115572 TaxID=1450535 RepID=A0A317XC87_9EURO|nr:subunit of DNA polymerase II [Aspergillus sclerotioniger CBS 115572]PWY94150.1 subunit of DNA polymerase II [Aspergillus sclerotioniger CBS 115572]